MWQINIPCYITFPLNFLFSLLFFPILYFLFYLFPLPLFFNYFPFILYHFNFPYKICHLLSLLSSFYGSLIFPSFSTSSLTPSHNTPSQPSLFPLYQKIQGRRGEEIFHLACSLLLFIFSHNISLFMVDYRCALTLGRRSRRSSGLSSWRNRN